ncbi:MAG: serine/threonine protein kinase [Gemmatales bacterium]|nr:serine/threonine protein kinase [Gemmatales bacterium]MDW8223199.1 serine/threonine-protein kinase [Gemmatales bacterium]
MAFSYAPGNRPLEPYTIKHALGSGGFGEVYYAVTDSGKEVALKCLRGECATELRGIRTCLNLAHPNLVAIHDLRQSGDGVWWLIMEYVAGPTWSALLRNNPRGLPLEQVLDWFHQLAHAVDFLHRQGIVHRDLKPSNIFLGDAIPGGWVKVGDYGLSKVISGKSAETHTHLGTVYYMAPEMAQGRYGPAVDIYAAGVMLYQLLTGRLPFEGQSVQEILLRHLTDEPDWKHLPSQVVPVLRQALAKDPNTRFATLGEVAQHLEHCVCRTSSVAARTSLSPMTSMLSSPQPGKFRLRLSAASQEPSTVIFRPASPVWELARSWTLAAISAVVLSGFLGVVGWNLRPDISWSDFAFTGAFALLASWVLLAVQRLWWDYRWPEVWTRCLVRIVLGMSLGFFSAWLDGASPLGSAISLPEAWLSQQANEASLAYQGLRSAAYFGVLFLLVPWEHLMRPGRPWRFDWNPVMLITLFAGALVWFWQQWEQVHWAQEWPKAISAALMAMLLQWASPHHAPTRR